MWIFLFNLVLTLAIEFVAYQLFFKKKDFAPSAKRVILANVISNPLAQIAHRVFFINFWFVELIVVIFEALFYLSKGKKYYKAFIVSLLLNLSSVLVGILIYTFTLIS